MKKRLLQFCPAIQFISCESELSYVVDYSKSTNKERGAELNCKTTDLPGLLIKKSSLDVPKITAAIFDDHCFKEQDSTIDSEHCEAVLFPEPYSEENWNLLVELKYDKQLSGKPNKAFSQLISTVSQLREALVLSKDKKVYGVVYFPFAGSKPPYNSSVYTYEELRRLNKEVKLILVSSATVTIVSNKQLRFS